MSDLIDRQIAIDIAHNLLIKDKDDYWQYNQAITDYAIKLTSLPSVVEKRGRWIYDENGMDWNLPTWVCSECHCRNDNIPTVIKFGNEYKSITEPLVWQGSRFCPNCGARMED